MNTTNQGRILRRGSATIVLFIHVLFLAGCSQQITGISFSQKPNHPDEVLAEGAFPSQHASFGILQAEGSNHYLPLVKKYAEQYGIDWVLILAVIQQESRFDHEAVSHRGAYGLMQIMPLTQIELAERLGMDETITPRNNIKAGIYHLKSLYLMFGNIQGEDRIRLTLAAYNAGLGRVLDAQKVAAYMGNDPTRWSSIRSAFPFLTKKSYTLHGRIWADGCPPSGYFRNSKQTIEYVENIFKSYEGYTYSLR